MRCDRLLGQEIFEFELNTTIPLTTDAWFENRLDASAMEVTLNRTTYNYRPVMYL